MRRKRRWRRVVYFFAGLFIAYWAVCYYLAYKYVHPNVTNESGPPSGFIAGKEAWYSKDVKDKTVFVLVHGYGGRQDRWANIATKLVSDGYGVAIPSLPGHDDLGAETCGFGVKEADCVLKAVDHVRKEGAEKVVLVGISMGGAACWLASEKDPTIDAVVTDGCFARLGLATQRWFDRKAPGASFFLRPVIWFASSMSGVRPADVNPIEAAARWKGKPALVIHGQNDSLFAQDDAKDLADASGARLWIVPGATHAQCCEVAFDEYIDHLEWFAKH